MTVKIQSLTKDYDHGWIVDKNLQPQKIIFNKDIYPLFEGEYKLILNVQLVGQPDPDSKISGCKLRVYKRKEDLIEFEIKRFQ